MIVGSSLYSCKAAVAAAIPSSANNLSNAPSVLLNAKASFNRTCCLTTEDALIKLAPTALSFLIL